MFPRFAYTKTVKHLEIMTKYSFLLGELQIISDNGQTSKVLVVKTGEEKTLVNKFAYLQDVPFEVVKVFKKKVSNVMSEEQLMLIERSKTDNLLAKTLIKSNTNYRNGKSGMSSLTK